MGRMAGNPRGYLALALAVTAWFACAGGEGPPAAATSTGSSHAQSSGSGGAPTCTADLDSIRTTIFAVRCADTHCHTAAFHAGELDLVSPGVAARLLDVTAATCAKLRVAPGKP